MRPDRIHELLSQSAKHFPDRPALQFGATQLTYADLDDLVRSAASELSGFGVRSGDRVVSIGRNRIEDVVLLHALSHIGAWPVLTSARAAAAQLEQIVSHCAPRLVVASDAVPIPVAGRAVHFSSIDVVGILNEGVEPPELSALDRKDDVAAVLYTSGSTGAPKAAMLSHENLVYIGTTQRTLRQYSATDKTFCPLPIAHVGALGISMCLIASGACLYLAERFRPDTLAAAILEQGVTVVPGLPPLHVKFMDWVRENPGRFEAGAVRLVTTSSSALHSEVKQAVEDLYGCPLQNAYGLTEASGVIFQVRLDQLRDDVSVGPALPDVEARIADADGPLGPGEHGEIQARGPNVFLGYYRDSAATRATFTQDGWLRTGDLGYLSGQGVAYVTGRAKETIKRSGYTILPAVLEAALQAIPGVSLAVVVSRPARFDEQVVAFVECEAESGLDSCAVLERLSHCVAKYELPDEVRLVDHLPTLSNGKIDRVGLRRAAGEPLPHPPSESLPA